MDILPFKTSELLKYLEGAYPDKVTTRELSAYEQGRQDGVIDLIRHLKQLEEGE
jgi:hypothetical protein